MTTPNAAVTEFLLTRRSHPAKTLTTPVPGRGAITELLTAAARVPDHGKLEPWRFVVLTKPALIRLSAAAADYAAKTGIDPDKAAKGISQFGDANLIVAVIQSIKPSEKVPEIEQIHSAGAACLGLVNAALAAGWGACWLTGWVALDRGFAGPAFDLGPAETVAGLIHIGTRTNTPPERPRPDIAAITTWADQ